MKQLFDIPQETIYNTKSVIIESVKHNRNL